MARLQRRQQGAEQRVVRIPLRRRHLLREHVQQQPQRRPVEAAVELEADELRARLALLLQTPRAPPRAPRACASPGCGKEAAVADAGAPLLETRVAAAIGKRDRGARHRRGGRDGGCEVGAAAAAAACDEVLAAAPLRRSAADTRRAREDRADDAAGRARRLAAAAPLGLRLTPRQEPGARHRPVGLPLRRQHTQLLQQLQSHRHQRQVGPRASDARVGDRLPPARLLA